MKKSLLTLLSVSFLAAPAFAQAPPKTDKPLPVPVIVEKSVLDEYDKIKAQVAEAAKDDAGAKAQSDAAHAVFIALQQYAEVFRLRAVLKAKGIDPDTATLAEGPAQTPAPTTPEKK